MSEARRRLKLEQREQRKVTAKLIKHFDSPNVKAKDVEELARRGNTIGIDCQLSDDLRGGQLHSRLGAHESVVLYSLYVPNRKAFDAVFTEGCVAMVFYKCVNFPSSWIL